MFTHTVTRALRKNKTLRYGVPMLVSPEGKSGRDCRRGGASGLAGGSGKSVMREAGGTVTWDGKGLELPGSPALVPSGW